MKCFNCNGVGFLIVPTEDYEKTSRTEKETCVACGGKNDKQTERKN